MLSSFPFQEVEKEEETEKEGKERIRIDYLVLDDFERLVEMGAILDVRYIYMCLKCLSNCL